MLDVRRLLEAAAALSSALRTAGIPHAFYGNLFTALLSNTPHADEVFCIVEFAPNTHPFRRVRQAIEGKEDITITVSPWSNRLHVIYHRYIPPIEIEILPAGEQGPRRLDALTVMVLRGVPFLSISEYVRAKLKAWAIRGSDLDAHDIIFLMHRYWNSIDMNRISEHDMNQFVESHSVAAPSWASLKRKYGM